MTSGLQQRRLKVNLRCFGPYDRKSRARLSIRHGDRNYDRSIAGLGTGKAQRYLAFDHLSAQNSVGRTQSAKINENNMLDRRFSIAPMMERTDRAEKQSAIST
jgi:hypothetical protein